MQQQPIKGACLCGACAYQADAHIGIFQYCHCSRCRKFTGSAFSANLFVKPAHFQWLGSQQQLRNYTPAHTRYLTTAFCNQCGSSLPWRPKGGKVVIIPAGTLDTAIDLKPQQNVHCASAAAWYKEPLELPKHAIMPPRTKSI